VKLSYIAIAAALLASGSAAAAQTAKDAQCIILSNAFANNAKDANAQKTAQAALYFYLGRVSDTATPAQVKTLLEAQGKTITDATAGGLMNECVKAIQAKVEMLQSFAPPAATTPKKKPEGR
jgi:hypothetical protein